MCCCCSCCACCSCAACFCNKHKITYVAAICIGIESVLFATLNAVLMAMHNCSIEPPQKDQLPWGYRFFEQVWSWFLYDEGSCQSLYGSGYYPPPWIASNPVPDYFKDTSGYNAVTSNANYAYQITSLIMNITMVLACLILFFGNLRKKPNYYYPFLIVGFLMIGFDISLGGIYIKFMDDTKPGWDDGRAIFSMIFIYLKGFFFVIFNIAMYFVVLFTFLECRKKRNRQAQRKQEITHNLKIETTVITRQENQGNEHSANRSAALQQESAPISQVRIATSPSPQQKELTPNYGAYQPLSPYAQNPYTHQQQAFGESNQVTSPARKTQPLSHKHQPFSYLNPQFRPQDSSDVHGMKSHNPVNYYDNPALERDQLMYPTAPDYNDIN